ncbi:MAG: gliding motility protein [Myxococcota bacterium]
MKLRREAREVHTAVDAAMALREPTELRAALEAAAKLRWFKQTSYRWAPWLWRRMRDDLKLRVALRPLLVANLDATSLDEKGAWSSAWKTAKPDLERWLVEVDEADDVEVFRELIQWKLREHWLSYEKTWRALLLAELKKATTPVTRRSALERYDFPAELDEATAIGVYEACGASARKFILSRLPWRAGKLWQSLFDLARRGRDEETAWELYRAQVAPEQWSRDVRELMTRVQSAEELDAELEKRHPRRLEDAGLVLLELAKARKADALPYLQRHVEAVFPRWGWFGRAEGRGLSDLIRLADENAWTVLWARLLQSSATPELWNAEVKRLLPRASTLTARSKLMLLTGAGGEWNFQGFGLAQVQPLSDEVALQMYESAPDLLRGPFRVHLPLHHQHRYAKLLERVLQDDDETLCDYFASRVAMDPYLTGLTVDRLTAHYEAMSLDDGTFIRRATNALSMMPAFVIWNYERLLEQNKLARLLFERSTPLYLGDGRLVRELLESPQIHVQALGWRVLATKDPRAVTLAAQNADLLAPTLLRPLHRRTRLVAFAALDNACAHDEATARRLLDKLRQTLALPDRKYPKEELVGLIGRALGRWPGLRSERERPRVFRREVA